MAIHFVYAATPGTSRLSIAKRRALLFSQRLGVPVSALGKRTNVDTTKWTSRAPFSITGNVYRELAGRQQTLLYDWAEHILIEGGGGDILIGHPFPDDDTKTWNRSCREGTFAVRIAMIPLSHQMAEIAGKFDPYIQLVDAVFGIMGPYWYDTWADSALGHWKEKIVRRIDMAIDATRFPRVKKRFNPPGKRNFFFLGGNAAYKGTHLLSILFGLAKRQRCIAIGSGPAIRNVENRPWSALSAGYMERLAGECDIFITMGVSDPNPTTILESMAWGFPVCCTPQSGYYNMPELVSMSITDMRHNLEMIERLQEAPEEQLMAQADAARALVEREYTWQRFVSNIVSGIEEVAVPKGLDPWAT